MNSQAPIWIKRSAVEAIRNPKVRRYGRSASTSNSSVNSSSSSKGRSYSKSKSMNDDCSESSAHTEALSSVSNSRGQQWGWMSGTLLEQSSEAIIVKLNEDSSLLEMAPTAMQDGLVLFGNDFEKSGNGVFEPPSDLITLAHLHEPAVVHCLKHRYDNDIIYTSTGPVLIALNPFKRLHNIYSEPVMKKYWDKAERNLKVDLEPHVYQIADASFRNMMRQLEDAKKKNGDLSEMIANQAILVSGESGAGKTVTTKFVMKYLAALSQRAAMPREKAVRAYKQVEEKKRLSRLMQTPSPATAKKMEEARMIEFSANSIESKVLQSNPILESFGNARTIRNDNSSRFGKFIELQFTSCGTLVGASIETYLLEKVRLVTQSPGERLYHIFFELLEGMSESELRQYYLASTATPDDFAMMNSSGTYDRRDGVSDVDNYKALRSAMNTMKFQPQEQNDIFSVTAALLHASNLILLEKSGHDDASVLDMTNIHLDPVCRLLGIVQEDLNEALCTFSIQAGRGASVKRSMSQSQAEKELEALIKAIYGALFQYLVMRINDSIAYQSEEDKEKPRPAATIGVLDIFGFESFATNSFEQLCINYCNEALQQQFNAFVLKNEQEEYEREGIDWKFIEFPENQDVLDLIDKRGSGILNILDDQCRAPGTSDRSFAADVYSKCNGHARFLANRKQVAVLQFEVLHYAGPVEYRSDGFLEKNRDELHNESKALLSNSVNPFVSFLSEVLNTPATTSNANESTKEEPYRVRRKESSSATVGGQFRRQLKDLRSKIDKTSPHYIRCIKPNDHLVPDHYDPVIIAEQLRCGGILEAVRVSRAGFPQHYPHADFIRRYKCVVVKEMKKKGSVSSIQRPIWATPVPQKTWTPSRSFQRAPPPPVPRSSRKKQATKKKTEAPKIPDKEQCKELLQIIYQKIQALEAEENKELNKENDKMLTPTKEGSPPQPSKPVAPWSKKKTAPQSPPSSIKSRYQPWKQQTPSTPQRTTPVRNSKFQRSVDFAKVGIQLGKTKVFLRHACFEILERIRSHDLAVAATRLNAIFRMYLSRIAYVPVRDAFRAEFQTWANFNDDKETKLDSPYIPRKRGEADEAMSSLIARFTSDVRASIHDPKGMESHRSKKLFKWVLEEGIWVKNPLADDENVIDGDERE